MNTKPKTLNQIKLSPDGLFVEFWFPYDFNQKEFVKTQFKSFYCPNNGNPYWRKSVTQIDMPTLQYYVDQFGAAVEDAVTRLFGTGSRQPQETSQSLSHALDADLTGIDLSRFKITPFPFQRAGIKYGLQKKKALLAEEMGLGKSIEALGIAAASGSCDRMIIVCPASIKINWAREVMRAIPDISVEVWDSKKIHTTGVPNCIILNYDILKKHLDDLISFDARMIIFDEIHYVKHSTSARSKAALVLAKDVEYVLGLTGTPVMNRPSELPMVLELLDQLNSFGGWYCFVKRYCKAFYQNVPSRSKTGKFFMRRILNTSGASNLGELNQKLRERCMVRRLKSEVLTELPPKMRNRLVFPISNRAEYDRAKGNLLEYVAACAVESDAFKSMTRLMSKDEKELAIEQRKIEVAESAERAQQLIMVETLKQISARGKIDAVYEWVTDFLETGQKLLVYASHIDVQMELLRRFPKAARVIARDDTTERQRNVDRFKNDPSCNLIINSLKAGGTGIDGLQGACSNELFVEYGWTPAEHLQAEDRLHRIGQTDQVTVWYAVGENTIDEEIQALLATKQAICDSVLDGADETRNGSIFNELMEVVTGPAVKTRLF